MDTEERKSALELFWCAIALLITFICLMPVIFTSFFVPNADAPYHGFFKIVLLAIPLAVIMLCYMVEIDCTPGRKAAVFLLLIALTLILVDIHRIYIDTTSSYFGNVSNAEWQVKLHESVVALSPKTLPHSYRFLPDSMVRFVEVLTGDFSYARSLYRHALMFALLFCIYYYARIRHSHENALLTVLLYSAVYPISIRYYAGQLVDPLSHLTFVLSFIFLELEFFLLFAVTVLIGIIAKESILVMPVFYLLFHRNDKNHIAKAVIFLIACAAVVACIRLWVVPGRFFANNEFVMSNLGGTALPHLLKHVRNFNNWDMQVLCVIGVFIPFLALAWRNTKPELRNLAAFLSVALLLSNFLFSWPNETRNLIPAVIPLAIITSDYLLQQWKTSQA